MHLTTTGYEAIIIVQTGVKKLLEVVFGYNSYSAHSFIAALFLIPFSIIFLFIFNRVGTNRINPLVGLIFLFNALMNVSLLFIENLIPEGAAAAVGDGHLTPAELSYYSMAGLEVLWICAVLFFGALFHYSLRLTEHPGVRLRNIIIIYVICALGVIAILSGIFMEPRLDPIAEFGSADCPTPWMPVLLPASLIIPLPIGGLTLFTCSILFKKILELRHSDSVYRLVFILIFLSILSVTLFITLDLIIAMAGYRGISLFPFGSMLSGILFLLALVFINRSSFSEMSREIARRREAEKGLQEAQNLLETSSVISFGLRGSLAHWRVQFISGNIEGILGFKSDDLKEMNFPFQDIVHSEDYEEVISRIISAVNEERNELIPISLRVYCKDRTLKWFNCKIALHREEEGLYRLECVLFDISEIRNLEQQLFQSQKIETLGRQVGSISHDFNNLIQGVLGYGELILRSVDPETRVGGYASNVVETAKKAQALASRLLAFSRKEELKLQPVDLHKVFLDIDKILASLIPGRVQIDFLMQAASPLILGDLSRIEQLLLNLIVNAADSISDEGEVQISTANVRLSQSDSAYFNLPVEEGDYLKLSVRDSGCGMEESQLEKIFEPFYTTKERGKGTGLGLSTVFTIVKHHHGLIHVDSVPGKGSLFEIYFKTWKSQLAAQSGSAD